mmetsp:Transcript_25426/g.28283  ORF Transcript_25426/g.28283 Transcript_25426/m.28283 type:complete len:154 (-) Transcript_25426:431-892(-)
MHYHMDIFETVNEVLICLNELHKPRNDEHGINCFYTYITNDKFVLRTTFKKLWPVWYHEFSPLIDAYENNDYVLLSNHVSTPNSIPILQTILPLAFNSTREIIQQCIDTNEKTFVPAPLLESIKDTDFVSSTADLWLLACFGGHWDFSTGIDK